MHQVLSKFWKTWKVSYLWLNWKNLNEETFWPDSTQPRLTVDFEHSLLGVISAGDELVVGPTKELSPVPLPDAPDGHREGHVAVIAEPRPLTQLPPIGPAPGNGVLTETPKLLFGSDFL